MDQLLTEVLNPLRLLVLILMVVAWTGTRVERVLRRLDDLDRRLGGLAERATKDGPQ